LFGDGAGAAILSGETQTPVNNIDNGASGMPRPTQTGILASYTACESDGQKPYFIYQRLHEPSEIFDKETKQFKGNPEKIHNSYIEQNGREVYQFVSKIVPIALEKVLTEAYKTIDDLKYIILHQANKRIIDHVIDKYNLDPEKVPISIDKYGNTSSSTIPILLHELNSEGKINKGDLIALVGFGSGLTYGAAVIRW
jgi:3-oxoacyl-[acyl-carrier-protein] synthase-3